MKLLKLISTWLFNKVFPAISKHGSLFLGKQWSQGKHIWLRARSEYNQTWSLSVSWSVTRGHQASLCRHSIGPYDPLCAYACMRVSVCFHDTLFLFLLGRNGLTQMWVDLARRVPFHKFLIRVEDPGVSRASPGAWGILQFTLSSVPCLSTVTSRYLRARGHVCTWEPPATVWLSWESDFWKSFLTTCTFQ